MTDSVGEVYRERHRVIYAGLIDRVINAWRAPESVRAENAELLKSLTFKAACERVKATSGWMMGEGRMRHDDPLLAWADSEFGSVESVAREVAGA